MFLRSIKRSLVDFIKTYRLKKFYSLSNKLIEPESSQLIILMIDGRMKHGGLSDRLCGIISAYQYCVLHNVGFKLNYTYPYALDKFLTINEYDWRISTEKISYNAKQSKPIYISLYSHLVGQMRKHADSVLKMRCQQIHLYSNMYYFHESEFGFYFNKLFKKTPMLDEAVKDNLKNIGEEYVSVTFRFQQLLGDFKETGFTSLSSSEEKIKLINRCLGAVEMVHAKEQKKVVVTSDSKTFLEIVQNKFDYVYIIPGTVVHMDYVQSDDAVALSSHLKSFVDFFVLANADVVYLVNIGPLYSSSFAKTAAMVYGKKYVEISDKPARYYEHHERIEYAEK